METSVENGVKNKEIKDSPRKIYKPEDFVLGPVKQQDYDKYMAFMMDHFIPREPLSRGLHLSKTAFEKHMKKLVKSWVSSGASVCATYVPDNELAGVTFTQILTRENNDIFVTGEDSDKDPEDVKHLLCVLRHLEKAFNAFEDSKINKVVEIGATAVHPKFSGNRITYRLADEFEKRAIELDCDAAISQSTNVITQHIRSKMGFEVVYTLDYETFEIDGKKVFDVSVMGGATKANVMRKYLKKK